MVEVQAAWKRVLEKWHPAMKRTIRAWGRPLQAVMFLFWKQ